MITGPATNVATGIIKRKFRILVAASGIVTPSAAEVTKFGIRRKGNQGVNDLRKEIASMDDPPKKGQQWFRAYAEIYRDPKLRRLPDRLLVFWLLSLALFCETGELPPDDVAAYQLRISEASFKANLKALQNAGLYDGRVPHNWDRRQYKSDNSTERVKRFRERSRNVSVTPSETETETETETEENPLPPSRKPAKAEGSKPEGASRRLDAFDEQFQKHLAGAGMPKVPDDLRRKLVVRAKKHNATPTFAASLFAEVYNRAHRQSGIQDGVGWMLTVFENEIAKGA